ncbi:hypothetical protein DFH06DRAFT_253216 [Mycena polygramma]|nr:hypothetical protein DFH06DRAFT_253216 [Mycena polygramma]
MSSVEQLRARIAEVSTEILLQKEVLKTLENDKSLAQRQLNAALDPVARLPLEISSAIFQQSLPYFAERKPSVDNGPMLLLHICHAWRDIALFTPELWTGIQITLPYHAPEFEIGVQTWLHRASNRPLSISLRSPGSFDPGATNIVWQHAQRIEHLDLCYQKEDESDDDEEEDDDDVYLLGDPSGPMPSLKTLSIRGLSSMGENQMYSGSQILELLRLATNLVECSFEGVSPIYISNYGEPLTIPTLRRLSFGEDSDDDMLKCLSLPGLEIISMPLYAYGGSTENLLSLLNQSTPPLRELAMPIIAGEDFTRLEQCLRLVPTLEKFRILRTGPDRVHRILSALADSPSLLPMLHSLTIHVLIREPDSSAFWTALLRALSSRRAHVRDVHVELLQNSRAPEIPISPTDEIFSAFRDLTAGGMQIRISLHGTSLI